MVEMATYKMDTNPCIVNCLELSTAHISPKDNELLMKAGDMDWGPIVYNYEYGFFVYAHAFDDIEYFNECSAKYLKLGFSPEFVELLMKARVHKCKYLQLDADGTIYDDVPTFEW
jgi:hypothetical protein